MTEQERIDYRIAILENRVQFYAASCKIFRRNNDSFRLARAQNQLIDAETELNILYLNEHY